MPVCSIIISTSSSSTPPITSLVGSFGAIACSSDGARVYTSEQNTGTFYASTDFGATWIGQAIEADAGISSVNCSNDGMTVLVATASFSDGLGSLFISTDGGINFSQVSSLGRAMWDATMGRGGQVMVATCFDNPAINDQYYISVDSGATWNPISFVGTALETVAATPGGGINFAIGGEGNGTDGSMILATYYNGWDTIYPILRSTNFCSSWTETDPGSSTTGYTKLIATNNDVFFALGMQYNGLLLPATPVLVKNNQGGNPGDWVDITIPANSVSYSTLASSANGNVVTLALDGLAYPLLSTNGGSDFTPLTALSSNYWRSQALSDNGSHIYMGINEGGDDPFMQSHDGGTTWA